MKIYLDENFPSQLAEAFDKIQQVLNKKNNTDYHVVSIKKEFGQGTKDEEWIPQVKGHVVITQDYRIQTTRHQYDLYNKHQVGMFFFSPPSKKGWDFMQITKILIERWEAMIKIIGKKRPPFGYRTSSNSPKFTEL